MITGKHNLADGHGQDLIMSIHLKKEDLPNILMELRRYGDDPTTLNGKYSENVDFALEQAYEPVSKKQYRFQP